MTADPNKLGMQEIRILGEGGLAACQTFASTLSLAACWGLSIAVATGSCVQTVQLDSSTGHLQPGSTFVFGQQISALAVVELPSKANEVRVMFDVFQLLLSLLQISHYH